MQESNLSRRSVFKLIAAASAAAAIAPHHAAAKPPAPDSNPARNLLTDPDFNEPVSPWSRPLIASELATLTALVDLILPADEQSPAASAIGVPDFLNEWIGAPYEKNIEDCAALRGGIAWINAHCGELHGQPFANLPEARQIAVLDSICDSTKTRPELSHGTCFFKKLRMLSLGGYYTHPSTWKSLGYVGNIPIVGAYPGVPDEIIKLLGLEA